MVGDAQVRNRTEQAVARGWAVLEACRERASEAERDRSTHAVPELARVWHPLGVGHGDLGVSLVLSVAAELDPDGAWDVAAHRHVSRAVERFRHEPGSRCGLLTGAAALAWALRSLSRGGSRYGTAVQGVENHLRAVMADTLAVARRPGGLPVDVYDMVSGLSGAVTYAMCWDATALVPLASEAVELLADRALDDVPRGLWTGRDEVSPLDVRLKPALAAGYRDLGAAHGVAGVLSVLGQASDRGIGGARVQDAALQLASELLGAARTGGALDVPYYELAPGEEPPPGTALPPRPTRHAWCYGNLGAALAFAHSSTLGAEHPTAVARLLPADAPTRYAVTDVGLCHGWAGALVLERYLRGDEAAQVALDGLLSLGDTAEVFGFRERLGETDCPSSPGFLDESGGAAAALVALAAPEQHPPTALGLLVGRWR